MTYAEYPVMEEDSKMSVVASGAFKSLPNLTNIEFLMDVDLFEELPFLGLHQLQTFQVVSQSERQQNLPRLFDAAPELSSILFRNKVEVLEDNTFEGLPALKAIDLRFNKITTLNKAFQGLPKVEDIDLSDNKLTTLGNAFKDLPSIKIINLADNSLTSLDNAFERLPNAVEGGPAVHIILKGNTKLTKLNASIKELLRKGVQIDLRGITLDCGCDMIWLLREPGMLNPLERFSAECADGNIPAHTLQVRAPVQIKKKKMEQIS